jgi:arylsulfatase A-like enzyme
MKRLLLLSLFLSGLCTALRADQKPNFVVFISDDHSQLDSQAYGSSEVRTPNMVKLAEEGLKFSHAFIASPSCGPSRTALLTGLWPARNGAEPNHRRKNSDVASLPPALRALGYECAAIGKVAHNDFAKDHGFDYIEGPNPGFEDANAVAKFLANRDATKPLCLFVGTRHPHTVWSTAPSYDPADVQIPPTHFDDPTARAERARYLTDVTKADTLLGEVRTLVRDKLPGNTVFIYTADHGAALPFAKWSLYDAGVRVPLIVAWPGHLQPGTTSDAMVCWPDLLPTFIELAGGQVPDGLDGRSFASVLLGSTTNHRDRVFSTHSGDGQYCVYPIRSVRSRDWKYIRNLHPEFQYHTHMSRASGPHRPLFWHSWLAAATTQPRAAAIVNRYIQHPAEELYDLTADPYELHNLADSPAHSARLQGLRDELDAWMKQQGDTQSVFGTPLLLGEPATVFPEPVRKKNKSDNKQKTPKDEKTE